VTVEICRESDEKLALRFVTGDRRLPSLPGLRVLALADYA